MNRFFKDFSPVDETTWMDKIKVDLKGKDLSNTLHYSDEIEGISYKAYSHKDSTFIPQEVPGEAPFTRGGQFDTNDWYNVNVIPFSSAQEMNKKALDLLMKGANSLRFDLQTLDIKACEKLIQKIDFNFITVTISYHTQEQHTWLQSLAKKYNTLNATFVNASSQDFNLIKGVKNRLIDGSLVQKTGGNVVQELAYLLHKGHNTIFKLMQEGQSIDDACIQLKFRLGIGSNYFFEIAKFRVFRRLWYQIVNAYQPEHKCSSIPYIEAETGLMNKSLKDPYNNLLRQTTEALSAIIGGVNELTILPYNWRAKNPDFSRSQRLATNIALILKEEAYLDKVIDPSGGAYAIEELTNEMAEKTWLKFQLVESNGIGLLQNEIKQIADKRVEQLVNNKVTLIGVNKFANPEPSEESWKTAETIELGKELILERDCNVNLA